MICLTDRCRSRLVLPVLPVLSLSCSTFSLLTERRGIFSQTEAKRLNNVHVLPNHPKQSLSCPSSFLPPKSFLPMPFSLTENRWGGGHCASVNSCRGNRSLTHRQAGGMPGWQQQKVWGRQLTYRLCCQLHGRRWQASHGKHKAKLGIQVKVWQGHRQS